MANFFKTQIRKEQFKNENEYFKKVFSNNAFMVSLIQFAVNQSLMGKIESTKQTIQTEVDILLSHIENMNIPPYRQTETLIYRDKIKHLVQELMFDMEKAKHSTQQNIEIQQSLMTYFEKLKNIYNEKEINKNNPFIRDRYEEEEMRIVFA